MAIAEHQWPSGTRGKDHKETATGMREGQVPTQKRPETELKPCWSHLSVFNTFRLGMYLNWWSAGLVNPRFGPQHHTQKRLFKTAFPLKSRIAKCSETGGSTSSCYQHGLPLSLSIYSIHVAFTTQVALILIFSDFSFIVDEVQFLTISYLDYCHRH